MAENEELDLDENKPSKKKNMVMYGLIGLLLIGFTTSTALLLLGGFGLDGDKEPEGPPPARYHPLETMVVNFGDTGPAGFLQVEMQVMSRDERVISAIKEHMPVIRNDVLLLLSAQSAEELATREGKEKLREDIRQTIQRILFAQANLETGVESVFFTSFVMQ